MEKDEKEETEDSDVDISAARSLNIFFHSIHTFPRFLGSHSSAAREKKRRKKKLKKIQTENTYRKTPTVKQPDQLRQTRFKRCQETARKKR